MKTYVAGYVQDNTYIIQGRGPTAAAAAKDLQRKIYAASLKALCTHRDSRLKDGYPDLTSEQMADFVDEHMDKAYGHMRYVEHTYSEVTR